MSFDSTLQIYGNFIDLEGLETHHGKMFKDFIYNEGKDKYIIMRSFNLFIKKMDKLFIEDETNLISLRKEGHETEILYEKYLLPEKQFGKIIPIVTKTTKIYLGENDLDKMRFYFNGEPIVGDPETSNFLFEFELE